MQKHFFNSLKNHRKRRGLKQKDVARILGLKTDGQICRWEKGLVLPNLYNAIKLAVLYRTMVDAFFLDLRRSSQGEVYEMEKKILDDGEKSTDRAEGK